MHIQITFISLCLIAAPDLSSLAAAQVTKADINPVREPAPVATGEIVAAIDPSYGGVFQDKDHNYWFGSSRDEIRL
jgi:hypothetical protein